MLKHINSAVTFLTSSSNNTNRFCYKNVFARIFLCWGGGVLNNVSQMLAIIDFFQAEKLLENVVSKENIIGNITLSQTRRLNLDKFGIGNYIPGC